VLGSILGATTTVRTLPVSYVVERSAFLVVDGRIGQDMLDRLESRKYLKELIAGIVVLTVFARCLFPA
jgi:hypothetical protein